MPNATPPHSTAAIVPPTRTAGTDILLAAAAAALALALYATLGLRLAQGAYLEQFNLAFDFDPVRYLSTLTGSPPDKLGVKHPLIVLIRPLAWPLLALGLEAKQAAVLVMAGFGAATVATVLLLLRLVGAGRPEAAALATLYAVGGTPIFTAIIVEAYGPAALGIAALWLVTARRLAGADDMLALRLAIGTYNFGITLTNVAQVALAELLAALRRAPPLLALRQVILFGIALAAIAAALSIAVWFSELRILLADPVQAIKEVYWLQTKGERTGPVPVLLTFLGYSFVSPSFDVVPLPEGIDMLDFRSWRFGTAGAIAMPLWLAFLATGTIGAIAHPRTRWLALGLLAALLFNIAFHLDFQFRGSLYLYAAHTHVLVFLLATGLAPWVRDRPAARWAYIAFVLALAALTAATNLPIADDFTRRFDISSPAAPHARTP